MLREMIPAWPQVLETGIALHSVLIGIALGVSNSPCTIRPLLAALTFHQFFEGVALGSCLLQVGSLELRGPLPSSSCLQRPQPISPPDDFSCFQNIAAVWPLLVMTHCSVIEASQSHQRAAFAAASLPVPMRLLQDTVLMLLNRLTSCFMRVPDLMPLPFL